MELFDGKKTTSVSYTYDADGNLISETGKDGTDKVELTYTYTMENRLEAVYDGKELLMAAAYDGDGNRVFQLNYNLHTDEDWKGNSGNGNGSNKDNAGSGSSGNGNSSSSGNNGNGNGNSGNNGNGNNGNGNGNNGNSTNAETNNSQNQSGILFPIDSETSDTESYLISLIKTSGKEKNYELIEYINDVNREYTEVLVEQNINGALDTAYVYGAVIGSGSDRLSLERFDGSTGYYLYDPRGSVTGITNQEGQVYQSYRYSAFGEITFGAPQYENEYTYNGESYNPNIRSQYLRARYYVVTAAFLTEDSYLGNITEPLTLNRYNYCVSSPVNYVDPSGNKAIWEWIKSLFVKTKAESSGEGKNFSKIKFPTKGEGLHESIVPDIEEAPTENAFDQQQPVETPKITPTPAPTPIEEKTQVAIENKETEQCDLQTWGYLYLDKDGNTIIAIWTISNEEFVDSSALSQEEITAICNEKNPGLVEKGFDISIYQTAIAQGINPKIILATLAQEQGWCKNGKYDKAFGVGPGGEPMSFEADSKGGLAKAIDTYLKLYNEGLSYEESSGLPVLLVNQDKFPYNETKAVFGEETQKWQEENAQYVIYMKQGIEIVPVNAAMYAKLRYTPWVDFPPQQSHPLETWLKIYNSFQGD